MTNIRNMNGFDKFIKFCKIYQFDTHVFEQRGTRGGGFSPKKSFDICKKKYFDICKT